MDKQNGHLHLGSLLVPDLYGRLYTNFMRVLMIPQCWEEWEGLAR